MESFTNLLKEWNKATSERTKLQHIYLVLIASITIIAGLLALINPLLGHQLILIASAALFTFLANAVVWALLKVYLLPRLDRKQPTKK